MSILEKNKSQTNSTLNVGKADVTYIIKVQFLFM